MTFPCDCFANILTAIITFLGFALTIYTLIKSNKEKSISNVIALKAEFRNYDEIYFKLLPNCEWHKLPENYFTTDEKNCKELGQLYSYLGLFEITYMMLKNGTLSKNEYDTFFSYRLALIYKNSAIRNLLDDQKDSWKNLKKLISITDLF